MSTRLFRRRPLMRRGAAALVPALLALGLPPPAEARELQTTKPPQAQSSGSAVPATSQGHVPPPQIQGTAGPGDASGSEPARLPARERWSHDTGDAARQASYPPLDLPDDGWLGPVVLVIAAIAGVVLLAAWIGGRAAAARLRDRGIGDELAADPPEVSFGLQPREAAATRRVAISNRTDRAIELSSIRVSGDGFGVASAPPVPFRLGPGERIEIDLTFQSATPCRCSGTVLAESSLPRGAVRVRLHARVR